MAEEIRDKEELQSLAALAVSILPKIESGSGLGTRLILVLSLVPRPSPTQTPPARRGSDNVHSSALLKIHSLISIPKKVLCHHAEVVKNFQCFNPQVVFSAM